MATRVRTVEGRRVIAVDGKSLRGATRDGAMPHLLAALDHDAGIVVAQRAVPDKGSEIPAIKELLGAIDLAGAVITADALHCQGTLRAGSSSTAPAACSPSRATSPRCARS